MAKGGAHESSYQTYIDACYLPIPLQCGVPSLLVLLSLHNAMW